MSVHVDKPWLDIAIKQPLNDAGPFLPDAGAKLILHTTEGSNYPGPSLYHETQPHLTIDFKKRKTYQHVPLNRSAKALLHPAGTVDTNRAGCIQVELVNFAADSPHWTEGDYRYIRMVLRKIMRHVNIRHRAIRPWNHRRFISAKKWVRWSGVCGHMHVPNNDHVDPGAIRIGFLLQKKRKRHGRR